MSAQMSPNVPDARRSRGRTLGLPLLGIVLVGAVCAWSTSEAASADRIPLACYGGAAALLFGVLLAVNAVRTDTVRQLVAARALTARAEAQQAETARKAVLDGEAARHALWDAQAAHQAERQAERQAAAESEARLRDALDTERADVAALVAEVDRLRGEAAQFTADADRLALEAMPAAVKQLRGGSSADTVLAQLPDRLDPAHLGILRTLVTEVGTSERMRASSMAACANAAGRVQALATSMLADLREMENRHREEVLGDLLTLDHSTAQAGRLADSIAVLTGARSGRRWTKPIVMESVLRGALGRISAYQRVRLHSTSTAAVAGYAAEGVMHALAELMDNAATFSPPTEEVHVYVQEMHSGVVVTIEDGGLVMPSATLARAELLVSAEPLDLMTLSGTRLGLAVVGCLARKHGLTVSFRPSSRGGTGVVVLIPEQLITRPQEQFEDAGRTPGRATEQTPGQAALGSAPAAPALPSAAASAPSATPAASPAAEPEEAAPVARTARTGLPKRPPGRTLAAATRPAAPVSPPASSAPRPDAGVGFGAFQAAIRADTGSIPVVPPLTRRVTPPTDPEAAPSTSLSTNPSTTPSEQNGQDTDR